MQTSTQVRNGGLRPFRPFVVAALIALGIVCSMLPTAAQAGLFEDDEARKAILDLRGKMESTQRQLAEIISRLEKLEAVTKGQISLAQDQENARKDMAKLRGDLEVLTNEVVQTQRKSKDLYSDLDNRIKAFEPKPVMVDGKPANVPAEQITAYENALAVFKQGEFQSASVAFDQFVKRYPSSAYAPSALYFQGSALYALKNYKGALAAQGELVKNFPDSARAPDAMLNIASNQLELKDTKAARKTLETLVEKYPDSPSAATAKDRLKVIK